MWCGLATPAHRRRRRCEVETACGHGRSRFPESMREPMDRSVPDLPSRAPAAAVPRIFGSPPPLGGRSGDRLRYARNFPSETVRPESSRRPFVENGRRENRTTGTLVRSKWTPRHSERSTKGAFHTILPNFSQSRRHTALVTLNTSDTYQCAAPIFDTGPLRSSEATVGP